MMNPKFPKIVTMRWVQKRPFRFLTFSGHLPK